MGDRDYDPNDAANRAAAIREQKYEEVKALLLEQNELHCAPHSTLVEVLLAGAAVGFRDASWRVMRGDF